MFYGSGLCSTYLDYVLRIWIMFYVSGLCSTYLRTILCLVLNSFIWDMKKFYVFFLYFILRLLKKFLVSSPVNLVDNSIKGLLIQNKWNTCRWCFKRSYFSSSLHSSRVNNHIFKTINLLIEKYIRFWFIYIFSFRLVSGRNRVFFITTFLCFYTFIFLF